VNWSSRTALINSSADYSRMRAIERRAVHCAFADVQFVQKVPTVQTPSFLLPRDAGEGWGLEHFERLERFERAVPVGLASDRLRVVGFPQ
jgi:hypothetical protein